MFKFALRKDYRVYHNILNMIFSPGYKEPRLETRQSDHAFLDFASELIKGIDIVSGCSFLLWYHSQPYIFTQACRFLVRLHITDHNNYFGIELLNCSMNLPACTLYGLHLNDTSSVSIIDFLVIVFVCPVASPCHLRTGIL